MPRPKTFDPDRVLVSAMELFWIKGFEATSLSDLERHLGLGRVSLYGAFGDKKHLFLRCLEAYRRSVTLPLLGTLDHPNGLIGIQNFFEQLMDAPRAIRRRGCLFVNTLVAAEGLDRQVDRAIRKHLKFVEQRFVLAVTNGQISGAIGYHIDARAAARMLVVLAHGTFALNRSRVGEPLAKAAIATALSDFARRHA